MPRFVAVLPLVPLSLGDGFSVTGWPLHVTVTPNFGTTLPADRFGEAFDTVTGDVSELDVVIGGDAMFGRKANVPVSLVEHSPDLLALHEKLLACIDGLGASYDDVDYTGVGFRGHVTKTRRARATAGDRVRLSQLALVDMEPFGEAGLRRVIWCGQLSADHSQ